MRNNQKLKILVIKDNQAYINKRTQSLSSLYYLIS